MSDDKNKYNEENSEDFTNREGFNLPEDYFDSFSARLFSKLGVEDELSEFKILSSIPKQQPFSVPDNYFEAAETKTELSIYEKLSAIQSGYVAYVPDEYFEHLSERIQNKVLLNIELSEFEKLSSLQKVNPFVVEESYFDSLHERIRDRIQAQQQTVSIFTWLADIVFNKKAAYAFGIVLIFGLSVLFFDKKETPITPICSTVACLEKQEILNSTYIKNIDEDVLMEMIDENALSDTLTKHQSKDINKQKIDFVLDNLESTAIIDEL